MLSQTWLVHVVCVPLAIAMSKGIIPRIPWALEGMALGYVYYTQATAGAWLANHVFVPMLQFCISVLISLVTLVIAIAGGVWLIAAEMIMLMRKAQLINTAVSNLAPLGDRKTPGSAGTARASKPPSSYQYEPILEEDEIRLLELLPGRDADSMVPLSGRIVHAKLSKDLEYSALSYCWMDDSVPDIYSRLELSPSAHVEITENLTRALRHVRADMDDLLPRRIWVDQICINQDDTKEKSAQVALMTQIYAKSAGVRVWLGEDTTDGAGARAFALARRISEACEGTDLLTQPVPLVQMDDDTLARYNIPAFHTATDDYRALIALLERPWFSRAWVVQEVAVRGSLVFCGTASIHFQELSRALFCCRQSLLVPFVASPLATTAFTSMVQSAVSYAGQEGRPSPTLLEVLLRHRCCKATNPEDKVFAFLGLAEDVCGSATEQARNAVPASDTKLADDQKMVLAADYSRTPGDVYMDVATAMLGHYPHLDILSAARPLLDLTTLQEPTNKPTYDLPSWVPNWAVPSTGSSLRTRGIYGEYTYGAYRAAPPLPPPGPDPGHLNLQFRPRRLGLPAVHLDTIAATGDTFTGAHLVSQAAQHRLLSQWQRICLPSPLLPRRSSKQPYPHITGAESPLSAFVATLTCGGATAMASSLGAVPAAWTGPQAIPGLPDPAEPFTAHFAFHRLATRNGAALAALGLGDGGGVLAGLALALVSFITVVVDGAGAAMGWWGRAAGVGDAAFVRRLYACAAGRRVVRTEGGYFGLVAGGVEVGDRVVLGRGGAVPLVVREGVGEGEDGERVWVLVGDGYVHGVMDGEAWDEERCEVLWLG